MIAAFVTGMFLFGIGLPLLIVGSTSTGYGRTELAMIIPGAISLSAWLSLVGLGILDISFRDMGLVFGKGNLCQLNILSRQNRFKIPASRYCPRQS